MHPPILLLHARSEVPTIDDNVNRDTRANVQVGSTCSICTEDAILGHSYVYNRRIERWTYKYLIISGIGISCEKQFRSHGHVLDKLELSEDKVTPTPTLTIYLDLFRARDALVKNEA